MKQNRGLHEKSPSRLGSRWEYFFVNVFVFCIIGILSILVLNLEIFDPVNKAFKDITLTDLYYSKLIAKKKIYNKVITVVNIEDKGRADIAKMIAMIQGFHPRVVGLDIIFSAREDKGNDSLSYVLNAYDNYVFAYAGKFDKGELAFYNDTNIVKRRDGYVNLVGESPEHSTIRFFYPYFNQEPALTTAIIRKFDPRLVKSLDPAKNEPCEIKYFGGDSAFRRLNLSLLEAGGLDSSEIKGGIVLFGYLGQDITSGKMEIPFHGIDEDKLFTPLNEQLSGRSYPDTHGVIIHANILRMMLDQEFIHVVPAWMVWLFAFLICWILVPTFCNWYINKAMWFHPFAKFFQLLLSVFIVFSATMLYHYFNIKLEAAILVGCIVFLVDFILFYDAFIKLLTKKLGIKIQSIFLGGHGHE